MYKTQNQNQEILYRICYTCKGQGYLLDYQSLIPCPCCDKSGEIQINNHGK